MPENLQGRMTSDEGRAAERPPAAENGELETGNWEPTTTSWGLGGRAGRWGEELVAGRGSWRLVAAGSSSGQLEAPARGRRL